MNKLGLEKLKSAFLQDPEILSLIQQKEHNDILYKIAIKPASELAKEMVKGDKGDPGKDGTDGKDGKNGEKGRDGADGKDGRDGFNGKDGKDGKDGRDGRDGIEISAIEIAKKVNTLTGEIDYTVLKGAPTLQDFVKEIKKGRLLELRDIKGARLDMNDMRWHGGGDTFVAGSGITITSNANGTKTLSATAGISMETPVGAVDGSNLTYTVSNTPVYVISDGMIRISTIDYTFAAGTITMNALIPPTQFIRSVYNT